MKGKTMDDSLEPAIQKIASTLIEVGNMLASDTISRNDMLATSKLLKILSKRTRSIADVDLLIND